MTKSNPSVQLLEFRILCALYDPQTGVEIHGDLDDQAPGKVCKATMYAALKRLEKKGLIRNAREGRTSRYTVTPRGAKVRLSTLSLLNRTLCDAFARANS